jgi:hypothetical protein
MAYIPGLERLRSGSKNFDEYNGERHSGDTKNDDEFRLKI